MKFRPKTQILLLGGFMILVSLILFVGVLVILPSYMTLRHSTGSIPRADLASLIRDVLVMMAMMAAFLAISARAVFRIRKLL